MKTKLLLTSVIALGVSAAIVGGFVLNMNNTMAETKAFAPSDSYTATNNHFVASFHGNKKLMAAYNDNGSDSTRAENVTIASMDSTSSISWKVSIAKYSHDSFANLKMGNAGKTIEGHSDTEFANIYNALNLGTGHYVSAMYTTTAISNIQDIAITWGAFSGDIHSGNESGNLYLLYKKSGESWTPIYASLSSSRIYHDTREGTDDVGTNGTWNTRRSNVTSAYIDRSNLLGETAQIAVAYDGSTSSSFTNFVCINTLIINRVESIKAMLHHWDKSGAESELCTSFSDQKSGGYVRIAMFSKSIEQSQVNELNMAANFSYGNAKESTYYNQLAYLCGVANVNLKYSPSSSNFISKYVRNNSGLMAFVIIMITGMVATGTYVAIKKKKHN